LLRESRRPWALKQRILGRQGHLSNRHAAEMLAEIAGPHLRRIVLAHVSAECNDPVLAADAIRERMQACGYAGVEISVASNAAGDRWRFPSPEGGADRRAAAG
jgi:phosphoribosyl 1,2-cyclic phosphodiesterase